MYGMQMLRRGLVVPVLSAALAAAIPLPAAASLIGDTITIQSDYGIHPITFEVLRAEETVVVGAGIELLGDGTNDFSDDGDLSFLFPNDSIDVRGDAIKFTFNPFNLQFAFIIEFSDLDWTDAPGMINDVTISDPNDVVIDSAQVAVNNTNDGFTFMGTVDLTSGAMFELLIDASHDAVPPTPTPAIPEATSLLVWTVGLIAVVWHRRRLLHLLDLG